MQLHSLTQLKFVLDCAMTYILLIIEHNGVSLLKIVTLYNIQYFPLYILQQ
jgi:hypothetical protein